MSTVGRIAWNTATRWIAYVVAGLVSMLIVPYLAGHLSLEGYGTVELMTTLVGFAIMSDIGQRAALSRHFAAFAVKKDQDNLLTYFNTALVSYWALSLIIGIICLIAAPWLVDVMKVEASQRQSAILLLRYYVPLYTLMGFTSATHSSLAEAYHRFDVSDLAHLAEVLLRPMLFVALLGFAAMGLHGWAIAMLISKAASLVITIWRSASISFIPWNPSRFQWAAMKELWRLGGVLYLFQSSALLVTFTAPIVLTAQLGPVAVALFRPAHYLTMLADPFVLGFSRQFKPIMVSVLHQGNQDRVQMVLISGTRFAIVLGSLFVVMLVCFGRPITRLWLAREFGADVAVTGWCVMLLALATIPKHVVATHGYMALGLFRMRPAVIAQSVSAVLTILIGMFLVWFIDRRGGGVWASLGMAGTMAVMGWLQAIFISFVAAKSMRVSRRVYFTQAMLLPGVAIVVTLIAGATLQYVVQPSTFVPLLTCMTVTGIVWLAMTWFVALDGYERGHILRLVSQGRDAIRTRLTAKRDFQ